MRRVRLLKVIVEPTFVTEDDAGMLSEVAGEPIAVAAEEWAGFPQSFQASLERHVEELEKAGRKGT
jgi:hypothetical protein